jgi:hypothetical protein
MAGMGVNNGETLSKLQGRLTFKSFQNNRMSFSTTYTFRYRTPTFLLQKLHDNIF